VLADGKTVRFLFLPPEDDPDTFVRARGKAAFLEALAQAKPLSQILVGEVASKVDMGTEEGRARFVAELKPHLARIEAPALGAMLRRRVAEMAGLAPADLGLPTPARQSARAEYSPPPTRSPRRAATPESQLLERVLRQPDLAATLDPDLVGSDSADGEALHALITFARESGAGLTLGQVSARFEGSDHGPAIEAALGRGRVLDEMEGAELDLASELAGLQDRLAEARSDRRKAELEARWAAGTLTAEERVEWASLQARQAAAKGVPAGLETPPKR
jgi:DNA primase